MADDLNYFAGEPPAPGTTAELAPGLWWLRMPLPMALDHINLWLHEDGDGIAIIDTGIRSKKSKEIWQSALEAVAPGRPVTRVIVTHFHPDHVGHAAWLCETHGVQLEMPRTEWLYARMLALDTGPAHMGGFGELFRRAGCPSPVVSGVRAAKPVFPQFAEVPPGGIKRISDGDTLTIGRRRWRAVMGHGHSPEHACLLCEEDGLFISGDIVLPRISPNIGVYPDQPEADPLADYLATLEAFRALPGDLRVLPSHNEPFTGLHARLSSLAAHHDERLARVMDRCAEEASGWDVAQVLFDRAMTPETIFFAMPEALSHINAMVARGAISRETGSDGVWHYRQT